MIQSSVTEDHKQQDDIATIEQLLEKARHYYQEAETKVIEEAFRFAKVAHEGQVRDSGEPYIQHPLEVAIILADLELDPVTIAAGLLHDVLEDTPVTRTELENRFGPVIVRLVDGVTTLTRIHFQTKEEHHAQSLRKMFLAMAEDLRVVLIKLADRLHNLRTLYALPAERQQKVARETLEIYSPLAHRLGIWSMKWEMDDQAFRYLDPTAYYSLAQRIARKRREREGEIEEAINLLKARFLEGGVTYTEIQGRPKHLYSIHQKMVKQKVDLAEIYDLLAVRVITTSIQDCYGALGLVHSLWKPIPGRFKDYIAMPKSNLYQSLHTTVVGPRGEPLEIQIRTEEMHRIAERGIAAHWIYKEGHTDPKFEEKVAWLRHLMEWLREMKDPDDFMETLKIDLFEDEVFVFTPKGDVKSLPAGSTPVDFAFSVHTDIGMRCIGAKVNGKIEPLNYRLSNGEFVEILTGKTAAPRRDWLSFVKTSKARSKIRSFLKEQRRAESVVKGKELIEKECRKYQLEPRDIWQPEATAEVLKKYGFSDIEDLYAGVGFGVVTATQVLVRLLGRDEFERRRRELLLNERRKARPRRVQHGILVKGEGDMLVRMSRCCNPVPGDKIIGYITRGRGVSVHRADCPNTAALRDDPGRQIEVSWDTKDAGPYPVEIEVEALDRLNLLTNIMNSVSEGKTNISSVNARTIKGQIAYIHLTVDITDIKQMESVMERIRKVNGVLDVHRALPT